MPEMHEICDNELDDDCDGDIDGGCALCDNGVQDEDEEGVDCGGPCPPCLIFPWMILTVVGVLMLVGLFVAWWWLKSKGEELEWESLKKRWSGLGD